MRISSTRSIWSALGTGISASVYNTIAHEHFSQPLELLPDMALRGAGALSGSETILVSLFHSDDFDGVPYKVFRAEVDSSMSAAEELSRKIHVGLMRNIKPRNARFRYLRSRGYHVDRWNKSFLCWESLISAEGVSVGGFEEKLGSTDHIRLRWDKGAGDGSATCEQPRSRQTPQLDRWVGHLGSPAPVRTAPSD